MKNLKRTRFFSLGRKWIFTLALFVLVFAAASILKVQAVSNVTGYLWGGSEETSDGTINGNESGVGWISMSGTNYGVTIPTGNTAVTGYAWANASNTPNSSVSQEGNGLGWIQFDPAPDNVRYPGCGYPASPCNGVMRNDDNLEGWARFVSIKDAFAANNSGGWEGWIKMRGPNYGVQISKMLGVNTSGVGSISPTYAWSNELGAIDFGQAKYTEISTLDVKPNPLTLQLGNNPGILYATVTNSSGTVNGKEIKFTLLPGSSPKISLVSSSCTTGATGAGECSVSARASDLLTDETAQIQAQCADSSCNATTTTINIKHTLACTIDCPPDVQVTAGGTDDYIVTVGGESGCVLSSCNETSDPNNIIDLVNTLGTGCEVTASSNTRYGTGEITARTNGSQACPTKVNVKGPGWIETNP